jgi:hypothetical protein
LGLISKEEWDPEAKNWILIEMEVLTEAHKQENAAMENERGRDG